MARTKRKVNPITPAAILPDAKRRIYRAAGYIRLSVEDSGKPGADTIEAQKELVLGYIEAQPDMSFVAVYCDNGRTGTNFERPGFEQLMEGIRTNKIDCVVVKDLSRFGRNYKETGSYLEHIFPALDVRFIAINDHFDTLTAEHSSDGYIIPLKNIMNEVYSKDISKKIIPALTTKRQRGEFIGTWAAYGYQKCAGDKHRIEPDGETAPVVRNIFQWRLDGMSYLQIARKLNDMEIPSPARYHYLKGDAKSERYASTVWKTQVIKKMLSNEVYLGHMVQGRKCSRFSEGRKQTLVPQSEWIIVHNTHEPLVDEAVFQAVQEMGDACRATYQERLGRHDKLGTIPNILRGLIFCADCKRPLVRYKSVTNQGKNLFYVYICPTHADDLSSCPKKYFHETELIEILWNTLRCEIALAVDMERQMKQYRRTAKAVEQEALLKREITDAMQQLDRAGMLYDSLYPNYIAKLMTEQEYMELKRQYQADMERAQARIGELERRQQAELRQTTDNPWLAVYGQYRQEKVLTEDMAHALIERVEIDAENHVSVTLRYQDEYRALAELLDYAGKAVPA